jgi:outer membrane biogenesis lipoprotein LolB
MRGRMYSVTALRLPLARLVALALLTSLLGCAARLPTMDRHADATPGVASQVSSFDLAARAAIRFEGQAETFTLVWKRRGDRHTVDILSPLGTLVAQLVSDPQGAVLTQSDGNTQTAASDQALFAQATRIPLRLATLAEWLHVRSDAPRLVDGWTVTTEHEPPLTIAKRLVAESSQGRLRLIVDEYRAVSDP